MCIRDRNHVDVSLGVAEELPYADGFFDLLISNNGLNNVQGPERAFSECGRVCKSGAQMVLTFNLPETMHEFYDAFEKTLQSRGVADAVASMQEHINEKRPSLAQVEEWLAKSGFVVADIQHDEFQLRFLNAQAMFHHHFIKYLSLIHI